MTKAQLIELIAQDAKITKVASEKAINSLTEHITKALKKGDKLTLTGFGTFLVTKRKARKALNPQTKKEITIPAARVPKFRPGKTLRDTIR